MIAAVQSSKGPTSPSWMMAAVRPPFQSLITYNLLHEAPVPLLMAH